MNRSTIAISFGLITFTQVACGKQENLVLQPGPSDGIDTAIAITYDCSPGAEYEKQIDNVSTNNYPEIAALSWTFNAKGCSRGDLRTLIKFGGMNKIPLTATITSAKLSFFGVGSSISNPGGGNSYYTGSPYAGSGSNEVTINRITSDWNVDMVTWRTKPATTTMNEVTIPASTSKWNYDAKELDVTNLVKDIQASANYGFMLQQRTEAHYRCMIFGSSNDVDPAKRPKLEITYTY